MDNKNMVLDKEGENVKDSSDLKTVSSTSFDDKVNDFFVILKENGLKDVYEDLLAEMNKNCEPPMLSEKGKEKKKTYKGFATKYEKLSNHKGLYNDLKELYYLFKVSNIDSSRLFGKIDDSHTIQSIAFSMAKDYFEKWKLKYEKETKVGRKTRRKLDSINEKIEAYEKLYRLRQGRAAGRIRSNKK